MTSSSKIIIKWGGILAGSAAIASVSAFITTRYLLKMAVDREEPKLMKLAGKRRSRSPPAARPNPCGPCSAAHPCMAVRRRAPTYTMELPQTTKL